MAIKGYAGAAQINPATIGRNQTVQLGSTVDLGQGFRTSWLPDLTDDWWLATPSLDLKLNRLAFAYTYKRFDFSGIYTNPRFSNPTHTADDSHKLAAAFDISEQFTAGLALNLIGITVQEPGLEFGQNEKRRSYSFDLGIHYRRDFRVSFADLSTTLGWSLTDFGPRIEDAPSLTGPGNSDLPLSMAMRGGLGLLLESHKRVNKLPMVSIGLYGSVTKSLIYFDDNNNPAGPFEALIKGWKSFEVQRNAPVNGRYSTEEVVNAFEQMTRHTGLNVAFLKALHVRWGRHREGQFAGNRNYDVLGLGLDAHFLAVNYSKVLDRGEDNVFRGMKAWNITARIPINGMRGNLLDNIIRGLNRS